MLYRMYTRYAESKGWKVTVLDLVPGEVIGVERASFQIEGRFAYGMLRSGRACTVWCAFLPPTTRSAATPRLPAWR